MGSGENVTRCGACMEPLCFDLFRYMELNYIGFKAKQTAVLL